MACEGRTESEDLPVSEKRRGRPRSTGAEGAILREGAALLAERGVSRMSMEAVAIAARVSKATIYRRWPSKDALILDLVSAAVGEGQDREGDPSSNDARANLLDWVRRTLETERSQFGQALRHLMRRAAEDPALAASLRRCELQRQRDRFAEIVRRGVIAGQIRPDLDLPTLLDMLCGPALYRRLLDPSPKPACDPVALARTIVDIVWPGIRT